MKAKLLKKLRKRGRNQISILSIIKTDGMITGMTISYNDESYSCLFNLGDSKEEVLRKAEKIYIQKYLKAIKYSKKASEFIDNKSKKAQNKYKETNIHLMHLKKHNR